MYVVDFCTPRKKLIIELDGSSHNDKADLDSERTTFFTGRGFRVLRFWNNEVLSDIDGVIKTIKTVLNES
jgi:very-short-patch-repair endonuclease